EIAASYTTTSLLPPWLIRFTSLPVSTSHRTNAPSRPADRSRLPSGVNRTAVTSRRWPLNVWTSLPLFASPRTMRQSPFRLAVPDARYLPSGENASARTIDLPWSNWRTSLLVSTFHRRIVLSSLPEATYLPSGENATAHTPAECPLHTPRALPVAASPR